MHTFQNFLNLKAIILFYFSFGNTPNKYRLNKLHDISFIRKKS
jgi:hypothetical protein